MQKEYIQLVHTLSYGDAISSEVLALDTVFKNAGKSSTIYALNVHPAYVGKAVRLTPEKISELESFSGEMILHYSLGSPLNTLFRNATKSTRTLIYHNLTPAKWFEGVNPRIVRDINQGAAELPELCRLANRVLADSAYNASELSLPATVLPLPIDPEKFKIAPNQGILDALNSGSTLNLLHVGRIAPNKCIEDIIRTFYFIHGHLEPNSVLWLVGIDIDTELYSFGLKTLVHELGLEHAVKFLGGRADAELVAFYQASTAYLCMSEHEGFCLPLLEAMINGCPVVSFNGTALSETVGNGGILFSEKRHAELAALLVKIKRDATFRAQLVSAGKERASQFSFETFSMHAKRIWSL